MEELINLVLGNPLLLLLIAGGLISLFRREGDKKTDQSQQSQQTGEQSQRKKSSPFGDFLERMEDALSDGEEEKTSTPTSSRSRPNRTRPSHSNESAKQTMSAHDKRMEQMHQLSNQIEEGTYEGAGRDLPSGVNDKEHSGISDYSTREINVETNHQTNNLRKQMKKRLNKKNLIDSVIMSEVLGEPRSKQPYQGRNMNRHNLY